MFDEVFGKILDIAIIILAISSLSVLIILVIQAIMARIRTPRSVIEDKNKELLEENKMLKLQIDKLENKSDKRAENVIVIKSEANQMVNLNSLKIKAEKILFITSQSFIGKGEGDSRIKIINYINSTKTDSVYSSFDSILEQVTGNFFMINKNQIINLNYVMKVQANEIYLETIKEPFYLSELKKEEFDIRINNLA